MFGFVFTFSTTIVAVFGSPSDDSGPDCSSVEDGTFYPYPGDCTQFWECLEGKSILFNCPAGLWWHQTVGLCDFPGDYCDDSTGTFFGCGGTGLMVILTGSLINLTSDPLCPYTSNDITYFPYPGDCTKFWECFAGVKYEMACPAGLWWHQEISQCDYPGDFCQDS